MLNFGNQLAQDNNPNSSILNDDKYGMSTLNASLKSDLSSYQTIANSSKTEWEKEDPKTGFGTLVIIAIIAAGKTFTGATIGLFSGLFLPLSRVIGIPGIVMSVFGSILVFLIIFSLWRVYKSGE